MIFDLRMIFLLLELMLIQGKEVYKVVVDIPSRTNNTVVEEGMISYNEGILGERDKAFSLLLKHDFGTVFRGIQAFLGSESVYT